MFPYTTEAGGIWNERKLPIWVGDIAQHGPGQLREDRAHLDSQRFCRNGAVLTWTSGVLRGKGGVRAIREDTNDKWLIILCMFVWFSACILVFIFWWVLLIAFFCWLVHFFFQLGWHCNILFFTVPFYSAFRKLLQQSSPEWNWPMQHYYYY